MGAKECINFDSDGKGVELTLTNDLIGATQGGKIGNNKFRFDKVFDT